MGKCGGEQTLSYVTSEAEWRFIERELAANGVRMNMEDPGLDFLKHIGFEMEMSASVGLGRFVVDKRSCQPFGVLHGGMTGLIAETVASRAGQYAAGGQQVQPMELNVNHLRATPIGEEVVVITKPIMKGGRLQVWEVKFEKEVKTKNGGPPEMAVAAICRVTLIVGSAIESAVRKRPRVESKL